MNQPTSFTDLYSYVPIQVATDTSTDSDASIIADLLYVIVKSHYEEVIVVITRVRGGAEDECNSNDNLQVQWDLTGFYPIVFDVHHVTQ